MKKIAIALSLVLGLSIAQPANAQYWGGYGYGYGAMAGMAIGALAAGAIISSANPYWNYGRPGYGAYPAYGGYYATPAPPPAYYYNPGRAYYYGY